ncbi:MAG: hypothetical protein JSS09_03085, partial [Verrucomicrobia bacterium]|nr:hypothetical protein [Verrucomicrobiota bacterium]
SANANPIPGDEGIVLRYKAHNVSDPDIQRTRIEPLFTQEGWSTPPSTGTTFSNLITSTCDTPLTRDRLDGIQSIFIHCIIPSLKTNPVATGIVSAIGTHCQSLFPNMQVHESFFKVRSGHEYYDATNALEFTLSKECEINLQKLN